MFLDVLMINLSPNQSGRLSSDYAPKNPPIFVRVTGIPE